MLQMLFSTADGKIPFIQIALGAITGAIGVLIYVRFYKPKILFPDAPTVSNRHRVVVQPRPLPKRRVDNGRSEEQRMRQQPGYDPDEGLIGAPVVLDLGTLHPGGAPELPMPAMFPPQEEDPESDDDDDKDDEDIDEEEIMLSTGKSRISELP
ncbi:hypothetical protein HDU90_003708 [Geranomyces variabilis]|nr:hypothetical protein HDU90_003708 [Geranomyces variabilis]